MLHQSYTPMASRWRYAMVRSSPPRISHSCLTASHGCKGTLSVQIACADFTQQSAPIHLSPNEMQTIRCEQWDAKDKICLYKFAIDKFQKTLKFGTSKKVLSYGYYHDTSMIYHW